MILFCEYAVPERNRQAYLTWLEQHDALWRGADILENDGQPGVFVELWPAGDEDEALRIQKERLEGRSEWREMENWIKNGKEGLRVWTFRSVRNG